MDLILRTAPSMQGEHSFGSAEKTLIHNSNIKIQITGPGAEVLLFTGPPPGKKWITVINVFVRETEV